MEWAQELPTEPGYYWCCQHGNVRLVRLQKSPISGVLFTTEDGGAWLLDSRVFGQEFGTHWWGPLQPPEPPQ